jgi:hypothetical protein
MALEDWNLDITGKEYVIFYNKENTDTIFLYKNEDMEITKNKFWIVTTNILDSELKTFKTKSQVLNHILGDIKRRLIKFN